MTQAETTVYRSIHGEQLITVQNKSTEHEGSPTQSSQCQTSIRCNAPNQICTHHWTGACIKNGWTCENLKLTITEATK